MQGKANTKSIYNILVAAVHGAEVFAAIGKLERRGQPYVAQRTILRAVSLASLGYFSPHMHRANIEVAVCAVRVPLDTLRQCAMCSWRDGNVLFLSFLI